MWRSGLPVIYSSIYLKRGGGVVILGEASGGALRSSTFCCCISETISFHNQFLIFFLKGISAEERRSGYEDVIFGCEYRNFDDCLKFCRAVSCFKMICNFGDQPEYPLSTYYYYASSTASTPATTTPTAPTTLLLLPHSFFYSTCCGQGT